MDGRISLIETIEALDAALAAGTPLLVFKHSLTCGTSAWAHEELEALVEGDPDARVAVVPVQTARPVAAAIAERTGVRHESPQALVFVDGRVVWHASHHRLTSDAMGAALAAAAKTR